MAIAADLLALERVTPKFSRTGKRTYRSLTAKIEVSPTGCWQWTGALGRTGYGLLNVEGRSRLAHRVIYVLMRGPVPEGLELDHLCKNRSCVNPDHLEAVTHEENLSRGDSQPIRNRTATHCQYGHEFTPSNTRYTREGWRQCRTCDCRRAKNGRARSSAA